MNGRRAAAALAAVGIVAAQAGHLVAYQLRFGGAALGVQSAGVHAYFPTVAKTGVGLAAAGLLAALFAVGLARMLSSRRADVVSAPSYLRLLAALFTLQLAFFALQETAEALAAGTSPGSVANLVLWGTAGQLPAAAVAALVLRWLLTRLRPAITELSIALSNARLPFEVMPALVPVLLPSRIGLTVDATATSPYSRRGPPSF